MCLQVNRCYEIRNIIKQITVRLRTCQVSPKTSLGRRGPSDVWNVKVKWRWRPTWKRFDPTGCHPTSSGRQTLKTRHRLTCCNSSDFIRKALCTSDEDFDRVPIPRPSFELPGWAHDEDGHDAIPIGWAQLLRSVDDSIRHRQVALFTPLQKNFVVSATTLLPLLVGAQESVTMIIGIGWI